MAGIDCNTDNRGGYLQTGVTEFNFANPCESKGVLTSWCVKMERAGAVKLKVFRRSTEPDGTNRIDFIGESAPQNVPAGVTTGLPCHIEVNQGDWIGIYSSSGNPSVYSGPSGYGSMPQSSYSITGDLTSSPSIGSLSINKDVPVVSSTPINIIVSVEPQTEYLMGNGTIPILIDPQGTRINSASIDILYNPSIIRMNSVTEGNLFSRAGQTHFSVGNIDSAYGAVYKIKCSLIPIKIGCTGSVSQGTLCDDVSNCNLNNYTNPPYVTSKGTFAFLNVTFINYGSTTIAPKNSTCSYNYTVNNTCPNLNIKDASCYDLNNSCEISYPEGYTCQDVRYNCGLSWAIIYYKYTTANNAATTTVICQPLSAYLTINA